MSCSPNPWILFHVTFWGGVVVFPFDVIASMAGCKFHPPANSIRDRKRLKYEGGAFLQKNCHNYIKAKKLHAPCWKDGKATGR